MSTLQAKKSPRGKPGQIGVETTLKADRSHMSDKESNPGSRDLSMAGRLFFPSYLLIE